MSLFTVVSNDVVLTVGPYAQVHTLASEQARHGNRVTLRRASPDEHGVGHWVVHVYGAGKRDVLHCLDEDDARKTLRELPALGLRAEIARI